MLRRRSERASDDTYRVAVLRFHSQGIMQLPRLYLKPVRVKPAPPCPSTAHNKRGESRSDARLSLETRLPLLLPKELVVVVEIVTAAPNHFPYQQTLRVLLVGRICKAVGSV